MSAVDQHILLFQQLMKSAMSTTSDQANNQSVQYMSAASQTPAVGENNLNMCPPSSTSAEQLMGSVRNPTESFNQPGKGWWPYGRLQMPISDLNIGVFDRASTMEKDSKVETVQANQPAVDSLNPFSSVIDAPKPFTNNARNEPDLNGTASISLQNIPYRFNRPPTLPPKGLKNNMRTDSGVDAKMALQSIPLKFNRPPCLPTKRKTKGPSEESTETQEKDNAQALSGPVNSSDLVEDTHSIRFRVYQAEIWTERFEELLKFRNEHGHCFVPNAYEENPSLAQWVKRQRYQYKLRLSGKRSAMSDQRVAALNQVGFVWDSHSAAWEERLEELREYKSQFGDCNVPSRYVDNRQLAIWVKRQRRQYKFFCEGKPSSMTPERISILEGLGFVWDLRHRA